MAPDLEQRDHPGGDKFGARVAGQELWYQGRSGLSFLTILVLAGALVAIIWLTVTRSQAEHAQLRMQQEALIKAQIANEAQNRINNWLLSISPEKRPSLQMPPEAWGLLTEEAREKMLDDYRREYERKR